MGQLEHGRRRAHEEQVLRRHLARLALRLLHHSARCRRAPRQLGCSVRGSTVRDPNNSRDCLPLTLPRLSLLSSRSAYVGFINNWVNNYQWTFSAFVGALSASRTLSHSFARARDTDSSPDFAFRCGPSAPHALAADDPPDDYPVRKQDELEEEPKDRSLTNSAQLFYSWIASLQGTTTHTQADRIVTARYSAFLFITQFIIFSLLGVLVQISELEGKAEPPQDRMRSS